MKRRLRQSYRPSPALLRARRQLAWRSAGMSLLLLGGLALGAALCTLTGLFMAGGASGSFIGVQVSGSGAGERAAQESLAALASPPDSPTPELADMQAPPMELLPVDEAEPVELLVEESWPETAAESPLQFPEEALAFQPPKPTPKSSSGPSKPSSPSVASSGGQAGGAHGGASAGQAQGGGKLEAASYRSAPKPPYPPALRSSRVQGTVGVRIAIDAEGRPTKVDITSPSGHAEFDRTARTWILGNWRFNPARRDGTPIPSTVTTRVEFVIS